MGINIIKSYITEIDTKKIIGAYNVYNVERSLSKKAIAQGWAFHSVELLTKRGTYDELEAVVLSPTHYRVSWHGRPEEQIVKVKVNITEASNVLSFDSDFTNLQVSNMISVMPVELVNMVENGEILFDTEYQRGYVWDEEKKQEYVKAWIKKETILTPYFVTYYEEDSETGESKRVYEVLDGKQRLNAVYEFLSDKLPINNLYFSDLLKYDQRNIKLSKISGLELKKTGGEDAYTRPDLKLIIRTFLDFNSGIQMPDDVIKHAQQLLNEEQEQNHDSSAIETKAESK